MPEHHALQPFIEIRLSPSVAPDHPVASLSEILFPRAVAANVALMARHDVQPTYNGRGALYLACRELAGAATGSILIPAFHCPTVVTPALHAGLTPVFYRIRRDLSVDMEDLLTKVRPDTLAVLVIHYFGKATDLTPLEPLRSAGVAVIEDWSHAFLRAQPLDFAGDPRSYRIFSFWKLVPSIVGGGLCRPTSAAAPVTRALRRVPLRESLSRFKRTVEESLAHSPHQRTKALLGKLEALRLALKRQAVPAQQTPATAQPDLRYAGEHYYPFDEALMTCAMPSLALGVLGGSDLDRVVSLRRQNFMTLAAGLSQTDQLHALWPQLETRACPWVFPVLIEQRDQIDHRLKAAGVALHTFGIYLHSALFEQGDAETVADARFLADHVLCLAIHQGIDTQQLRRTVQTILRMTEGPEVGAAA